MASKQHPQHIRHHHYHHHGFQKWAILEMTFLGLCLLGQEVNARILVYRRPINQLIEEYNDMPSTFGPSLPPNGLKVFPIPVVPYHSRMLAAATNYACERIAPPPRVEYPQNAKFVAIIQRGGNCTFELKVRNAQNASFQAAIIYNNDGDDLEQMSADNQTGIRIPSVFVGQTAGENLNSFFTDEIILVINDELPFNINTQLILPFSILIGLCFLVMIFYMIYKYIRDERRSRRNLLPKKMLKKLPILKYSKNCDLSTDTCVICLDDFAEGDKIRILPCRHPYHSNCIDPWLTQQRRTCPICKRKVFTKGEARTPQNRQSSLDSITDTDDDTTPLLQQPRQTSRNSRHNTSRSSNNSTGSSSSGSSSTHHGTFSNTTNSSGSAAPAGLSAANSATEIISDDENALLDSDMPSRQRGRINPFDRNSNLNPNAATTSNEERRSIWSYPILRLFRRQEPLSIAAPAFNDSSSSDVEGPSATSSSLANNQVSQPTAMLSNNILNPNLSGSFKDESDIRARNNDDNSSTDDSNVVPHHNIYEPIEVLIGTTEALPPANMSQARRTTLGLEATVPSQINASTSNNSTGNAGNAPEVDSMFIQTPTQGGIGVVALPNTNNSSLDDHLLATTTIQPNQQDNTGANSGGHQRFRRGFYI